MKTIIIPVDGEILVEELHSLEDWQAAVGGNVEAIPFGDDGCSALVNEDGKFRRLAHNITATLLCAGSDVGLGEGDYIAGTMLIVGPPDDDGNTTDVPESLIRKLKLEP